MTLSSVIAGESDSHSLYFESSYNWTGLLVEPTWSDVLRFKNRKAVSVYNCLSVRAEAHYVEFDMSSALRNLQVSTMAGIVKVSLTKFSLTDSQSPVCWLQEKTETSLTLQCLPLYSLLLALGNPTVNWFILDIEGAEFQVLQTIPWHLVDIEMISVETDMAGLVMPGSRQEIIEYMKAQGYHHR